MQSPDILIRRLIWESQLLTFDARLSESGIRERVCGVIAPLIEEELNTTSFAEGWEWIL